MTKKHALQAIVFCITVNLLFSISSCTKEQTRDGSISAAVGNTCGSTVNFSGTHVFAYKETSGAFAGMMLVGGYHAGDAKEMGFYLPWSGSTGTYTLTAGNSGYYDATNSGVGSEQYGTTGSGTVTVSSISLASDNITINSITVTFSNVQMQKPSGEIVCINNGSISF